MFDLVCIIVSFLLLSVTSNKFWGMSFAVFLFFLVSHIVYEFAFLEIRSQDDNGWLIFQLYSAIIVACSLTLKHFLKSHVIITRLLALNILYNICTSLYFIYDWPEMIFNLYAPVCGTLAVLCLCYQWMVSDYGIKHINKRSSNNNPFIKFLLVRHGIRVGGLS